MGVKFFEGNMTSFLTKNGPTVTEELMSLKIHAF